MFGNKKNYVITELLKRIIPYCNAETLVSLIRTCRFCRTYIYENWYLRDALISEDIRITHKFRCPDCTREKKFAEQCPCGYSSRFPRDVEKLLEQIETKHLIQVFEPKIPGWIVCMG